jgi:hypothetical protein
VVDIATFHEHGPVPVAFTTPTTISDFAASAESKSLERTYNLFHPGGASTGFGDTSVVGTPILGEFLKRKGTERKEGKK